MAGSADDAGLAGVVSAAGDGVPRVVDVVVVGAGAAGAMAAIQAAEQGVSVALLEKNRQPGLKILISGGGRCNLTTTRQGDDLEAQFGLRRGRFLRHALRSFPPTALAAWFEAAGVALQEEDLEKLFPVSQQARDVVEALLQRLQAVGVQFAPATPVRSLQPGPTGFRIGLDVGDLTARAVVLATGGLSYPKTGASGDGYAMLRGFGHTITATYPALAPLAVAVPWVVALQGIVLHDVAIAVLDRGGRERLRRQRPILFTHRGLSGPAAMDLAGDVEELAGAAQVRFDFTPDQSREELEAAWLGMCRSHGARRCDALLPAHLPDRLRRTLLELAGVDGSLAGLSREGRRRLLDVVKDLRVPVTRSLGYAHAEVTRGGVALDEIEPRTMQSRKCPGLFVAGELLDVDGPIGGFNFTAAFATGRLAGLAAAAFVAAEHPDAG